MLTKDAVIQHIAEIDLTASDEDSIADLLAVCFPDTFDGRSYYKQLPHARILLRKNNVLIGQAGLDCRVVRAHNKVIKVVGIIDLCVHPSDRRRGYGTLLLQYAEIIAFGGRAKHLLLFADCPDLYLKNGYQTVSPAVVKWLAIEDLATHSIQLRHFENILLEKKLCYDSELSGEIDLLGYLY